VDIYFQGSKLERICNDQSQRIRTYGPVCGKLIGRRLDQFRAVANLNMVGLLPQMRCHELKGDRKGTLAVDLEHPYRLVFEPANEPVPRKSDGGLDWTNITAIRVLAVEDYHD